jgi:hypothetical protein
MPRLFAKKLPDPKATVDTVQARLEDISAHLRGTLDGFRDGMGLPPIEHSPPRLPPDDADAEFLTLLE